MVTEMVVKESLSGEMISAGAELTRCLDDAKFLVSASLWYYMSDTNTWRLIIASPMIEVQGIKKAYKQIQSVIFKMPADKPKISLKDITVVGPKDPLVSLLRVSIKTGDGISGMRLSQNIINGVLIEDTYIYRLT
ncbi:MAG: hypothetical protein HYV59_03830 [Planctomycetes bacterium]|nr:hypothetical protein [Planctomycetota bacterium]